MAMQQALLAAFAAVCLLSLTVASEDPTGSLPGVIDLSKLLSNCSLTSWSRVQPAP